MKKIVYWHFTLKALSLLVLVFLLFAYQSEAQTAIDYPLKPWDQWVVYKDSNFGDYRKSDLAYHSGIDLTLKDSIKDGVNKPVYAIADGQVFKVDERKLGWSVVIKHTSSDQQFIIPEHTQEYQYRQEEVPTIFSVYIHIILADKLQKAVTQPNGKIIIQPNGVNVKKGEIIGYINEMPSGIVPHLHFEIRYPNIHDNQSTGGSMLYPDTNWSISGDYLNMQILVESGARNPLEFLEANLQTASPSNNSVDNVIPTIAKVEPAMASASGGTWIAITGTGFKANSAPTVTIGGSPAIGVKVLSETTIKALVPAGVTGPADIVIQNAYTNVKSLPFKGFTYYDENLTEINSEDFFPLTKGSYWVYKGLVKWMSGSNAMEKTLTWRMEVVDILVKDSVKFAVLKGHPDDLSLYKEGKIPGNHLITYGIDDKSKRFVLLLTSGEQAEETLRRISNNDSDLNDLDYNMFLNLPLAVGKKFGKNLDQPIGSDNIYCWSVEFKDQIQVSNVKGISSSHKMNRYRLVYRTDLDDTTVEYIQGIGIMRYAYKHHNVASETDLTLIEYGKEQVPVPAMPSPQTLKPDTEKLMAFIEMEKGGRIAFKFYPKNAPITVDNFIKLANKGFYNGVKFHRVISRFMAQGGDPLGDGKGGPGYTIKDEFNSRKHVAGTVAMAKTSMPNSAGSQFYICLEPQPHLDGQYTVFGQVIEGMDVVNKIQGGDVMKNVYIVDSRTNPAPIEYDKEQVSVPANKSPVTNVEPVPTITKVEPAMASVAGGTEVTITGTGFKTTPAPTVTIGGAPATGVKAASKTSLKATVPPGVAGPADIVVQNAKAKVKSMPFKAFSYYDDVMVSVTNPDPMTADPEGIDAPAKIDVTFNQDVEATSVMIKVAGVDGNEVAGEVMQDATDTKMFSFTPGSAMKAGMYAVTVSHAIGVASQKAMPSDHTFSFTVKETQSKSVKNIRDDQKTLIPYHSENQDNDEETDEIGISPSVFYKRDIPLGVTELLREAVMVGKEVHLGRSIRLNIKYVTELSIGSYTEIIEPNQESSRLLGLERSLDVLYNYGQITISKTITQVPKEAKDNGRVIKVPGGSLEQGTYIALNGPNSTVILDENKKMIAVLIKEDFYLVNEIEINEDHTQVRKARKIVDEVGILTSDVTLKKGIYLSFNGSHAVFIFGKKQISAIMIGKDKCNLYLATEAREYHGEIGDDGLPQSLRDITLYAVYKALISAKYVVILDKEGKVLHILGKE